MEFIRDERSQVIGYWQDWGDYITLHDERQQYVGMYYKNMNITLNDRNVTVGYGNLLMMLLKRY